LSHGIPTAVAAINLLLLAKDAAETPRSLEEALAGHTGAKLIFLADMTSFSDYTPASGCDS